MEDAVSERRKAFAAAHRSDEGCQAYISPLPDVLHLPSPRPRLRHGRRRALLSLLNLTLNLHTHFFALSLALLTHLPLLLTSPTVLLPWNRLRSSPREILRPEIPLFSLSQRPCVAEPEATFLSSAEPHALSSFTRPFAPPSTLLNFLRLPLTFSRPLLLPRQSCLSYVKASSWFWHGFFSSHL